MSQKTVGVRELKARLSTYLDEVKNGNTIVVTEHGKPVGRITPIAESLDEKLLRLAQTGKYTWNGKKVKPGRPLKIKIRGKKMISDIVSENRD